MAIDRTPIIDDDGTGETGTVLNNAWKQELYDQIDDALGSSSGGGTDFQPQIDALDARLDTIEGANFQAQVDALDTRVDAIEAAPSTVTILSSTLTGTVTDWAPAGRTANTLIEWNGANDLTVRSIAGAAGHRLIVKNISTGSAVIRFEHGYASAAALMQLGNLVKNNYTPVAPGGWISYVHDGARWQLVAHEQGAWIVLPYQGSWFTCDAGTWTVESTDVLMLGFKIIGKDVFCSWYIATTTTSGAPTQLRIALGAFGGYVPMSGRAKIAPGMVYEGAGYSNSYIVALDTLAYIYIARVAGGAFAAVANALAVYGDFKFETA